MKSAVTVSLVPEARGGPFVFWDDLPAACRQAAELGFDAVELFPPGPDAVGASELRKLLGDNGLALAAVGTGAGWVKHRLTLTSLDAAMREKAVAFIRAMIDFAGPLGAPAIIGSMQGRWGDGVTREAALGWLTGHVIELGEYAEQFDVPLLYEPLNRYETNLANTLEAGAALAMSQGPSNVRLLADLYHMNIEEADLPTAIRAGSGIIGHVHFVDSNRRPAGMGHTEFGPIVRALQATDYAGYLSAEALPYPDSRAAAEATIRAFRNLLST
jgi:sugar phosphate isomerase/epimerase